MLEFMLEFGTYFSLSSGSETSESLFKTTWKAHTLVALYVAIFFVWIMTAYDSLSGGLGVGVGAGRGDVELRCF